VMAIGQAHFLKADMVRPGAVVVDVGMNRLPDGKLVGDVDFEGVRQVAAAITPVPGGVGPMTITMLLHNTLAAARFQAEEDRGQRTEDRGQRTEDRRQRTEDRRQRTEVSSQKSVVRSQRTEDRGQKTGIRSQRLAVTDWFFCPLSSVLCLLSSVF